MKDVEGTIGDFEVLVHDDGFTLWEYTTYGRLYVFFNKTQEEELLKLIHQGRKQ